MSTDRTAAPAEPDAVQPSDAPIPAWFDNLAGLSWRFLVVAASAMAIIWVLAILDVLLLPMFLALLFASAFLPLDRRLRRLLGRPGLSIPMITAGAWG